MKGQLAAADDGALLAADEGACLPARGVALPLKGAGAWAAAGAPGRAGASAAAARCLRSSACLMSCRTDAFHIQPNMKCSPLIKIFKLKSK